MSAPDGTWDLLVDGASRGNPGPAAAGVLITDPNGLVLFEEGRPLGRTTNNQAEYLALHIALREAAALDARRVRVRTDSQLLVRQMNGQYRVKNPALQGLHAEAQRLAAAFKTFEIVWVERSQSAAADRLANEAFRQTPARPGSPLTRGGR